MKNLGLTLLLVSVLALSKTQGQGDVPVSMYTGSPQITVPFGTIVDHDLSVPVYLSYDATGVRVKQPSGPVGIGWSMIAGGSITREVRDLPDDGTSPVGWINLIPKNTYPPASDVKSKIVSFANSNTCPITDSNETAVQTAINGYYSSLDDTEPDVFNFSFPGFSGSFVFDNASPTPNIHLIPWQDIKVTYSQSPHFKTIGSFTITTHDGVQYIFSQTCTETRTVSHIGGYLTPLQRDNNSYSTAVTYTTEWKLTQMLSPSGGNITFGYGTQNTSQSDTISSTVRNAPPATTYTTTPTYVDARSGVQYWVTSVGASSGASVQISYGSYPNVEFFDSRTGSEGKNFGMTTYTSNLGGYTRTYLQTIVESSECLVKPPYVFTYLDGATTGVYLPPPWSKAVDFWGYSNGYVGNTSLVPTLYMYPSMPVQERVRIVPLTTWTGNSYTIPGANRTPSSVGVMAGTLSSIQYPTGGITNINYEPNQYYDAQLGKSLQGGGIRIKSFTYYDGMNANATITKTFTYNDSTGQTSGRLISRPMFAAPVQQYINPATGTVVTTPTGDWTYQVIGLSKDLSSNEMTYGSAVGYKEVTVTRPGSGYARYQYLVPGTYGDAATGAWAPAKDNFARVSPCPTLPFGVITAASPWQYPYSRSADFDYERGLVWQKREYNSSNILVRRTKTYYQYIYNDSTSGPYRVYGLLYDQFPNTPASTPTYVFSKYNLLTGTNKVPYKEIVTTYDAAHSAAYTTTSYDAASSSITSCSKAVTEYDYTSTFHHLLTQVKSTTADGTVYCQKVRYPLDYGTIPARADTASQMINTLQTTFRNGTPIEQWAYTQKPDSVKKYTSGSLVKFGNFGVINFSIADPLPEYAYSLNLLAPLTSYDSSYVDPSALTFHNNSNYELTQTFKSFDGYGNPQTTIGQSQIPGTTAWGFNGSYPVVSARNVRSGQFAFSDFETANGSEFSLSTATYSTGRTGENAASVAGVTLTSKTIQTGGPNYMFSLWLNNAVSSTFTITIWNSAKTTSYYTGSVTWTPAASGFQYFETTVPVSSSLSSFIVTIQCTSSGTALIDDVSFYPVGADLSTYTYTIPFGRNSVTTNGNVTQYNIFDGLGRPYYVKDTYQNIREKDVYTYNGATVAPPVASFTVPTIQQNEGEVLTFTAAANPCMSALTYSWQMSTQSGSTVLMPTTTMGSGTSLTIPPLPTYALQYNPYTVTITLTVSHPVYGFSTATHSFSVNLD